MMVLGLGAELAGPARPDIAFFLYAAGRVVDGATLYVDVVEINPPLIIALNVPAVLLARLVGVADVQAYRVLVAAGLLAALAFAAWSLRRLLRPDETGLWRRLVVTFAFALFLMPGDDFGQREHLLAALTLPYLVQAAGRIGGWREPFRPGVAAGVLAGIGLSLKPQFLVVWLAVEVLAGLSKGARRPSFAAMGIAGVLVTYAAAVALLTPDYLRLVRQLGPTYAGYGNYPFLQVLVTAPGTALCLLAALVFVALRARVRHEPWCRLLLVAMIAGFVAAAVQQKGWGYHFYPARVLAVLLLALAVFDLRRPLERLAPRWYAAASLAALGTIAASLVVADVRRILHREPARQAEQRQLDGLVAAIRRHLPPQGSLYSLSYSIEAGFPVVNYSGARWASRLPCLWILESVYQERLRAPAPLRYNDADRMGEAERYVNRAVYEDLSSQRPDLLLVLRHARDVPDNAHRRFDYVGYFARDARIARELASYRLAEEVGEYRLYRRARSPDEAGEPPRSVPGRLDLAGTGAPAGARARAAMPGLLVPALLFVLLALTAYRLEGRAGAVSDERRRQPAG